MRKPSPTPRGLENLQCKHAVLLSEIVRDAQVKEESRQRRLERVKEAKQRQLLESRFSQERKLDASRVQRFLDDNDTLMKAYASEIDKAQRPTDRAHPRSCAELRLFRAQEKRLEMLKVMKSSTVPEHNFVIETYDLLDYAPRRRAARARRLKERQRTQLNRLSFAPARRNRRPVAQEERSTLEKTRNALLKEQAAILENLNHLARKKDELMGTCESRTSSEVSSALSGASYATFGSNLSHGYNKESSKVPRLALF